METEVKEEILSNPKVGTKGGRLGRPKKSDIVAKKKGNRGLVGRPAGDAARINEFKARLLGTTGDKVITKIIEIAMNDDHPGQMAALKFAGERILPISAFEAAKQGGSTPTIQINVSGLVGPSSGLPEPVTIIDDVTDVEVKEYNDKS
jgi:hypothetical protein